MRARRVVRALLLVAVAAAAASACGPKAGGPAGGGGGGGGGDEDRVIGGQWDDTLVDGLLAEVKRAVGCPSAKSKHRIWCIAADGWANGEAAELPASPALLVGLTLSLAEGDDVEDWLERGVHLSAMGVRAEGATTLVRIAPLVPNTEDEMAIIKPAVESVEAVLRAESERVVLPQDLADYLSELPAAANREVTRSGRGWRFKAAGDGQLRKVGATWVAIEIPPDGPRGILISIFTDRL